MLTELSSWILLQFTDQKKRSSEAHGFQTHLLEAVVLITVGTVPAVPVAIGHHCVLVAKPAIHVGMDGLLSAIVCGKRNLKCIHICQTNRYVTVKSFCDSEVQCY